MYDRTKREEKVYQEGKENKGPILFVEPVDTPFFVLFFWSMLLSLISVANPLLTNLANNLQSQNLYAGWAMTQGQIAYGNIYGTSGLLYYLANWAGSLLLGNLLFAGLQVVALFFSGIYLFKIAYQFTGNSQTAQKIVGLFYLITFILGFGGLYSAIFAFPFVLWGLYFLLRYLADEVGDNAFIKFGAIEALLFLIHPFSFVVFVGLSTLVLLVYNIIAKKKARGFYQLLASCVGFSLVFYPIGYYTVLNGSFGVAISQITYPWSSLSFSASQLLGNSLLYIGLSLGLGFLFACFASFLAPVNRVERSLQLLSSLGFITVLVLAVLLPEQAAYQLLPALPFSMILLTLWLGKQASQSAGRHSRSRRVAPSVWQGYFLKNLLLPILAFAYLVGYPVVQHYLLESGEMTERTSAAQYIRDNSSAKDKIYAWDKTASLYQESKRLSAVPLLSPTLYLDTDENRLTLANGLKEAAPSYILLHNDVPVLKDVQTLIGDNYQETDLKLSHFKLYKLK